MGIYDSLLRPKVKVWYPLNKVVKWAAGAALVGFLLGLAVGVSADPGTTRNYATQTISFFFDEGDMAADIECPAGWKWEVYTDVPDPDHVPALVPLLVKEGACPRG